MINDGLNSRSINFLGLVASLDLFTTLSLVLLSILLINDICAKYLIFLKENFTFLNLRWCFFHFLIDFHLAFLAPGFILLLMIFVAFLC